MSYNFNVLLSIALNKDVVSRKKELLRYYGYQLVLLSIRFFNSSSPTPVDFLQSQKLACTGLQRQTRHP